MSWSLVNTFLWCGIFCGLAGTRVQAGSDGVFLAPRVFQQLGAGGQPEVKTAWCTPLPYMNSQELVGLFQANCNRVNKTAEAVGPIAKHQGGKVYESWLRRVEKARAKCEDGLTMDARSAAAWALLAWSDDLMEGKECCNVLGPPYCVTRESTQAVHFAPFLVAVLVLLLVFCSPRICSKSVQWLHLVTLDHSVDMPARAAESDSNNDATSGEEAAVSVDKVDNRQSPVALPRAHKRLSIGRLPHAEAWLDPVAELMERLQLLVGFQGDSVRNQFEHLLSLWRSECSMEADEMYEHAESASISEETLIGDAVGRLHDELMDGFTKYQNRLRHFEVQGEESFPDLSLPLTALPSKRYGKDVWPMGSRDSRLGDNTPTSLQLQQLARIVTFLLVWGEAGNLRFMPEVLYFFTDLLLAADLSKYSKGPGSTPFLTKVIRPLYNRIFETWYQHVKVSSNKKDAKKVHSNLEKFMPADCPNYDDWNELFCDPSRMCESLVLKSGTKLFSLPLSERFANLEHIDWAKSLKGCKTHREVHSIFGLFYAVHRILFLHVLIFCSTLVWVSSDNLGLKVHRGFLLLAGRSLEVRCAAVGLLVPCHCLVWTFSWCCTSGEGTRRLWRQQFGRTWLGVIGRVFLLLLKISFWMMPFGTYAAIRFVEAMGPNLHLEVLAKFLEVPMPLNLALVLHFFVSFMGAAIILLAPMFKQFPPAVWRTTPVACGMTILRWTFWTLVLGCKAWTSIVGIRALNTVMEDLQISRLGTEAVTMMPSYAFGTQWDKDVIQWIILMGTGFLLFISDTQFWFSLGCSVLGTFAAIQQRGCGLEGFASLFFGKKLFLLPQNFCNKVLHYMSLDDSSVYFFMLWDKIIEYWHYEDKVGQIMAGNLSFYGRVAGEDWGSVKQNLDEQYQASDDSLRVSYPYIFQELSPMDRTIGRNLRLLPDAHWPTNPDVLWRLNAIARSLTLQMPRPFRSPYMPVFSVIIPHYGETILMVKKDLFKETSAPASVDGAQATVLGRGRHVKGVPLIAWLEHRYSDEFEAFSARMGSIHKGMWVCDDGHSVTQPYEYCPHCPRRARRRLCEVKDGWPNCGTRWDKYKDKHWEELCEWASMRSQTLWRTVAGMTLYHQALQIHHQLQPDRGSSMYTKDFPISEIFTCMVSMQMYAFFDNTFLQHTNKMLDHFEDSLCIAYIDVRDPTPDDNGAFRNSATADGVHKKQDRRYYSCLIDKHCDYDGEMDASPTSAISTDSMIGSPTSGKRPDSRRRIPRYRVELPGYPILGDGKGDNQNHAIIYSRGIFSQCIDANQGAYFEQMLLLPCVFGEFRRNTGPNGQDGSKKIVGFPEHITSDFGSIGDFAAGAETAFGTILQRSYALLGARMHYGHPDMMNKCFMIQQGGVSKATKTVNLSEDIFAGMDFTLRGDGRTIQHSEYFHVAKGRDLGFGTVLQFFSKLSAGTGEQLLTRQMARLGEQLGLPEFLGFYYAHGGFYVTQYLLSKSMPMLVYVWLLMSVDDGEITESVLDWDAAHQTGASVMAKFLISQFSTLLILFMAAGTAPLVFEVWIQTGFISAWSRLVKMMCTLAPLHFLFQAKIIGAYVSNEIIYGGATYVSTGRGLPIERRSFIGSRNGTQGLYQDYAPYALYDGAKLLVSAVLVGLCGGLSVVNTVGAALLWWLAALSMTITSWLFAPFIFNPYQYDSGQWLSDVADWWTFFFSSPENATPTEGSRQLLCCDWTTWYEKSQLRERSGNRASPVAVLAWIFFLASWWSVVNNRLHLLSAVLSMSGTAASSVSLLPPVFASMIFCATTCAFIEHAGNFVFVSMVTLLSVAEATAGLYFFWLHGWYKTVVAGLLLKYSMLSGLLVVVESLYRMKDPPQCRWLRLWLLGHRMARDILVSGLIFSGITVGYFFDFVRVKICCCSYSPHNLLIYRDPGSQSTTRSEVIDIRAFRERNHLLPEQQRAYQFSFQPGGPRHADAGQVELRSTASLGGTAATGRRRLAPPLLRSGSVM